MTTYSITVAIEEKTLKVLKADPQNVLVLVRDMGLGDEVANGNIVFATYAAADLSRTQTFTWKETYQIFETEQAFEPGNPVKSGTADPKIDRGQTVDFQDVEAPVTGQRDDTKPINSINNWKNNARVVLGCATVDKDGQPIVTPHYISAPRAKKTRSALTPVTSFSVLVRSNTKTKAMIDVTEGETGRFQITEGKTDCEVLHNTYEDIQWKAVKNAAKIPV